MARSSTEESTRRGDGGSRQRRKDDGSGAVNGRRRPDPVVGSSCVARRTKKGPASAPAGGSVELVMSWSGRSTPGAMVPCDRNRTMGVVSESFNEEENGEWSMDGEDGLLVTPGGGELRR